MTAPPLHSTVLANGLSLAISTWNPGAARTAVFLHGYLDQRRSFDGVCGALPPDVRCVTLDWRGHGDSDRHGPGGSYHLLDHLKDLDAVLAAVGGPKPVLVGHSMGGNVAALHAGSQARALGGLVLLETLGPPAEDDGGQPQRLKDSLLARRVTKPPKRLASMEAAVERLLGTNPGLTTAGAQAMAQDALVPVDGGLAWKFDPAVQGPAPYRFNDAAVVAFLRNVDVPVLLVRAEHGYVPPREHMEARYGAVAHLEVVEVPGVSHHVHVDAVDVVAQSVAGFLARLG